MGAVDLADAAETATGLMQVEIGDQLVTLDTTRFTDIGPAERVVCILDDGRIGFCSVRSPIKQYGGRAHLEAFRAPRPGDARGAVSVSSVVHVLGTVVDARSKDLALR